MSESILAETLGLDKLNIQLQETSNNYLEMIARNTASLNSSGSSNIKPSNTINIDTITIPIEGGTIQDPEQFAIEFKDIILREIEFDSRAGGF
jgi:hypothetical protein